MNLEATASEQCHDFTTSNLCLGGWGRPLLSTKTKSGPNFWENGIKLV